MEEIAFTVVAKPYEAWEFYTDSSSGTSAKELEVLQSYRTGLAGTESSPSTHNKQQSATTYKHAPITFKPYNCVRINPSTKKPCNATFSRKCELTGHRDSIHFSRKRKMRWQYRVGEKTFGRNSALTRRKRVANPYVKAKPKPSHVGAVS